MTSYNLNFLPKAVALNIIILRVSNSTHRVPAFGKGVTRSVHINIYLLFINPAFSKLKLMIFAHSYHNINIVTFKFFFILVNYIIIHLVFKELGASWLYCPNMSFIQSLLTSTIVTFDSTSVIFGLKLVFKRLLLLLAPSSKNLLCTSQMYGEGNGSPLQYSCLENTMDGGAW